MLVPVMLTHGRSGSKPLAATMSVPGAAMSGLYRPSRVGPWLLVMWMRSAAASRLATPMVQCPQASELTEVLSTLERAEKNDFEAFLELLPKTLNGQPLRHVVEPRHESFQVPDFIEMLRRHGVAAVCADHHDYPMFADPTADFVYARMQKGNDETPTCYPPKEIDAWAERLKSYAAGGVPDDLQLIAKESPAERKPRDVFAFFISGGKVNAPRGAVELQQRIG